MSTRKLIREARRLVEDAGCSWAGYAYRGNDHIRIAAVTPEGRPVGLTIAGTPRNADHTLAIARARLRGCIRADMQRSGS